LNPKGQRRSQAAQAGEELWGHLVCEGTGLSGWGSELTLLYLLTFSLCVSLLVMWASCRQ
jgi:hypothetical protein